MTGAEAVSPRLARAGRRRTAEPELVIGLVLVAMIAVLAVLSPWLRTMDPEAASLPLRFRAPLDGFLLGSDHIGRDLWSRAITGLTWSMACALTATLISFAIGTALGLAAAERPGLTRTVVLQATGTVIAIPGIVVAICVIAVIGQGFWPLTLTLGLLSWPVFARVVFAEAQSLMERDYVRAARLFGVSRLRVIIGHVLPGLRSSLFVMAAFHFADMLIAESALSFLGIGAPVGAPTWGNMLAESRPYLWRAPAMLLVPAGFIVAAVIALNLLGDGLAARFRKQEAGA